MFVLSCLVCARLAPCICVASQHVVSHVRIVDDFGARAWSACPPGHWTGRCAMRMSSPRSGAPHAFVGVFMTADACSGGVRVLSVEFKRLDWREEEVAFKRPQVVGSSP